jgi:hypothetical protein
MGMAFNGAMWHPSRKHSCGRVRSLTQGAKPRVPAKRRRRENVMQSTNGSSPKGPLT